MDETWVGTVRAQGRFLKRLYARLPGTLVPPLREAAPDELRAALLLLAAVIRGELELPPELAKASRRLGHQDRLAGQFYHDGRFRALLRRSARDPDRGRQVLIEAERALALALRALYRG